MMWAQLSYAGNSKSISQPSGDTESSSNPNWLQAYEMVVCGEIGLFGKWILLIRMRSGDRWRRSPFHSTTQTFKVSTTSKSCLSGVEWIQGRFRIRCPRQELQSFFGRWRFDESFLREGSSFNDYMETNGCTIYMSSLNGLAGRPCLTSEQAW